MTYNLDYDSRRPTALNYVSLTWKEYGWYIEGGNYKAQSRKDGIDLIIADRIQSNAENDLEITEFSAFDESALYKSFKQNEIEFPNPISLGEKIAEIWAYLSMDTAEPEVAQKMFDQIGKWISACEMSYPDFENEVLETINAGLAS